MQVDLIVTSAGPGVAVLLLALLAATTASRRQARFLPLQPGEDAGQRQREREASKHV